MTRWSILLLPLAVAAGCGGEKSVPEEPGLEGPAPGGSGPVESGPEGPSRATEALPKAAVFLVGGELDPAAIQALGGALAGLDGVLAAKPEPAAGTFVVTFRPGATDPEVLAARLRAAVPGVEFMGLTEPADLPASHDDCGACPYKDRCNGSAGAAPRGTR